MKLSSTAAVFAATVALTLAAPAGAQIVTAQQCLAAQLRQAGQACKGIAKCYVKAMMQGEPLSTSCIDIKQDRLVAMTAEFEPFANCLVEGQATSVGEQIEMGLDDIATDLTLGGGRCAGVKMGALGKACNGFFRCNAYADRDSTTLDPECIAVHAARLSASFAKIEAGGSCVTNGDLATEQGKVANLVDSVRIVLRGTGTTTTTATATTN